MKKSGPRQQPRGWYDRTVLCIDAPDDLRARLLATHLGEPGITDIDRGRRPADVRPQAHIAERAKVHTKIQTDPRHGLSIPGNDCIIDDEIEGLAADHPIWSNKEW